MSRSREDPLFASTALRRRLASVEAAAVAGIAGAIGWSLSRRGLLERVGATDERAYADATTAGAIR